MLVELEQSMVSSAARCGSVLTAAYETAPCVCSCHTSTLPTTNFFKQITQLIRKEHVANCTSALLGSGARATAKDVATAFLR
jgi:hypothetical protein